MPTTTETEQPRKKKRRIRILWIVIGSPIALILLLALGAVWYQANLQSQIDAELAKIRALGEPATIEELAAVHRVPPGAVDRTQEWLEVFERVRFIGRSVSYYKLQDKMVEESDTILTGGPWPNEPAVSKLMQTLKPTLQQIEALAAKPGEVRYPYDFTQGDYTLLTGVDGVYDTIRVLTLRVHWQVRHGKHDEALKSLLAMRQAVATLKHEPFMNSQYARAKLNIHATKVILRLLPHAKWSGAQLEQLQHELLTTTMKRQTIQPTVVRNFVVTRAMFDHPEVAVDHVPLTFAWTRRADELHFLQMSWQFIEASQGTSAKFEAALDAISQQWDDPSQWEQWHHWLTMKEFPFSNSIVHHYQRSIATDRAAASLIACQQYHLAYNQWPEKLTDLTPEFLDQVPLDPLDNKPLRYQVWADEVIVYSLGENLIDDGGMVSETESEGSLDIVLTLPRAE